MNGSHTSIGISWHQFIPLQTYTSGTEPWEIAPYASPSTLDYHDATLKVLIVVAAQVIYSYNLIPAIHYACTDRYSPPISSDMPFDATYKLIASGQTVTAVVEQDLTQAIDDIAHKIFPQDPETSYRSSRLRTYDGYTQEDLDRTAQCGKFPYRPSDLFLKASSVSILTFDISDGIHQTKMYCDVLDSLEHGPLKGVCSPALLGSSGVVPMSIVSLFVTVPRVVFEGLKAIIQMTGLPTSCVTIRTLLSARVTRFSLPLATGNRLVQLCCAPNFFGYLTAR